MSTAFAYKFANMKFIGKNIELAARKIGGIDALAKQANIGRTALYSYIKNERSPKFDTLLAIADACETTIQELISENQITAIHPIKNKSAKKNVQSSDVPIYGTAAGSLAGSIILQDNTIGYVQRPDGLRRIPDAYALYVTGNSMSPRYNEREMIFAQPGRPIFHGDIVIIQQQNHNDGEITSFIKEYVSQSDKQIRVRQYNPEATIEFNKDTVKAMHRVLTSNEYFGV